MTTSNYLNLPEEDINEIINEFASCTSSALTSTTYTMPISSSVGAISGGWSISNSSFGGSSSNTIINTSPPSISISGVEPTISTDKHKVNIDDLYEDILSIKQIMIELAKDEDLMERSTVIRDILSDWLIKGLSK
jgi:hypothetical protein